jgi:hypothetical protein
MHQPTRRRRFGSLHFQVSFSVVRCTTFAAAASKPKIKQATN